jgi:protein TonB
MARVLVMPEAAQIDERHYELEFPPRRWGTAAAISPVGELPPPLLSRSNESEPAEPLKPASFTQPTPRQPLPPASVSALASFPTPEAVGTTHERLPQPLSNPPPVYPSQARLEGRQGTVVLELTVDADGRVSAARVVQSSSHPVLDAAAQRALRSWRFTPGQRGGQPVEMTVRLPVHFRLD